MDILGARARIALACECPLPQRALTIAPPPPRLPAALPSHRRLASLLAQLCDEGAVAAGVQVCVQRNSATLAECCAGFRGIVDPRGMASDVPMPLLELSALLPVAAVHAVVGAGLATYDTKLSATWPGCSAASAAGYTISDALSHLLPLNGAPLWQQHAGRLSELSSQLALLGEQPLRAALPTLSTAAPIATAAATAPASPTRGDPRASGAAQGLLLAGIVEGVCGGKYPQEVSRHLDHPVPCTRKR